jgi:photoactive yellow protein
MDLPTFTEIKLGEILDQMDAVALDALDFGVIKMDLSGVTVHYNRHESDCSGLSPQRVVGREFFVDVAPCAHNYLVAQRLFDEASLDAFVDYVFTWKLSRTPVRLRLLKSLGASHMYLLVARRTDAERTLR